MIVLLMQKFSRELKDNLKSVDKEDKLNEMLKERLERQEIEAKKNEKLLEELNKVADKIDKEELSTADELTLKTNVIDYILSSFSEEEMDYDRTTYTARIYTNIGIKYAVMAETALGSKKAIYEDDKKYFLDKAMVEWEILLDEFKIDRKTLAGTMYKIYLLMGDELTAGEIKKEFSL